MKPFTHAPALGICLWVPTGGSSKRFFFAPTVTAPLAILSAHDCGSEGEKRFTLTQGGRVHEGSAPSDKRTSRLMVDCCRDRFSGSINKAAELYTGVCPIQDSPKAESRTLTNHHPYRSPCMPERKVAP
jgi:hypothetical protein